MGDDDNKTGEKLPLEKDRQAEQIKTLMDKDAHQLEDKIANLRTIHHLDSRCTSAHHSSPTRNTRRQSQST